MTVFHAGTSRPASGGAFHTSGGRVLAVTAVAPTLAQARADAYAGLAPIEWDGLQYRTDIAASASNHVKENVG